MKQTHMKGKLVSIISLMGFVASAVSEYGFSVDFPLTPAIWLMIAAVTFFATTTQAALQTNGWIASGSGKWETNNNWSAGVPALSNAVNIVSGGSTLPSTAIIDAITSGNVPGSMTISNLIVRRFGGIGAMKPPGTVSLVNAGTAVPLHILNSLTISIGGTVSITNSVLRMDPVHAGGVLTDDGNLFINTGTLNEGSSVGASSAFYIGSQSGAFGALLLNAGQLVVTNTVFFDGVFFNYGENDMYVGYSGTGQMTVSNGTCYANQLYVAVFSPGTLTVAGGSVIFPANNPGFGFPSFLSVGTGTVWVTGGLLDLVGDGQLLVGDGANGQMIVSNGNCVAGSIYVGNFPGVQGTLTVAGGNIQPQMEFALGIYSNAVGTVWMTGGVLGLLDGQVTIGSHGAGQLTVSNGTWQAGDVYFGGYPGSQGTLTVAGGAAMIASNLYLGYNLGTTGIVWLTGGRLVATNANTLVFDGYSAPGQITISNGTFSARQLFVGDAGQGMLTLAGGTNSVTSGPLYVGSIVGFGIGTGTVFMTGGQLVTTNADVIVGYYSVGQMTVTGGSWVGRGAFVGNQAGSQGTLTIAGGEAHVYSNMTLGLSGCASTGIVNVTGGNLYVTNAAHNAVLEVRSGTFTQSGGFVKIDTLVITNACGHFVQTGGTLIVGGVTNIVSSFQITVINQEGSNVRITWMDAGGHTNLVQATNGVGANYATNFTDLSQQIILPGSGGVTTNYLDVGGATNVPARYYRVRLVP